MPTTLWPANTMPGVDPSLLHRLASAHAVAGEHDAWRRPIAAASPSLRCWPGPFYVTSRRCRLPGDPPYRPTSVATDDQGISTCSRRWPHVCPPPPRRLAPRCLPGTTPCTTPNPRRSRRPGTAGSCCPRILPVDVAAAVVALHVLVRSPLTSRSGVPKLTVIPSGATQHRTPPVRRSRRPDAACSCCPPVPPVLSYQTSYSCVSSPNPVSRPRDLFSVFTVDPCRQSHIHVEAAPRYVLSPLVWHVDASPSPCGAV